VVGSADLIDPQALAQALIGTADYAGALEAYRRLDMKGLKIKDKLFLQYMTATCLRKLGKIDDAATLYREVASSKVDPILADCAQWQLGGIRWRRDAERRLEELKRRRQALGSNS
jgi:hypothetical protein